MDFDSSVPSAPMQLTDIAPTPIEELLTNDFVTIIVGPERKQYVVHKEVLRDRSSYFKTVSDSGPTEHQGNVIIFAHDHAAAFGVLLGWMYSGVTPDINDDQDLWTYLRLWILADRLKLWTLRDETIGQIRAYCATIRGVSREVVEYVYYNTRPQAQLLDFIAGYTAYWLVQDASDPKVDGYIDDEWQLFHQSHPGIASLLLLNVVIHTVEPENPATWDVDDYCGPPYVAR